MIFCFKTLDVPYIYVVKYTYDCLYNDPKNTKGVFFTMNKQNQSSSGTKRIAFAIIAVLLLIALIVLQLKTNANIDPETYQPKAYSTIFSLLPPVIAIVLALITKEVYSSLVYSPAHSSMPTAVRSFS